MNQNNNHEDLAVVIDSFHMMLEAFEEYIGKLAHYPNWNNQRQIHHRTIEDSNDTVEGFEDLFFTQLLLVSASTRKKTAEFRQEIQKEYFKWIDAVGITAENCPEKLKHYCCEINELLEGSIKIKEDTSDYIKRNDIKWELNDSQDRDTLRGIFGGVNSHLNHPREYKEVNIKGQAEAGKAALEKIASSLPTADRANFHFYQGEYWNRKGKDNNQNDENAIKKERTNAQSQIRTQLAENNLTTSDLATEYQNWEQDLEQLKTSSVITLFSQKIQSEIARKKTKPTTKSVAEENKLPFFAQVATGIIIVGIIGTTLILLKKIIVAKKKKKKNPSKKKNTTTKSVAD